MTDITELMQRLKETASKATQGEWQVYGKPVSTNFDAMYIFSRLIQGTVGEQDALYMLSADGLCPALTGTGPNSKNNAEFIAQANPANILALVEALEKAQTENTAGAAGMVESYETTISMLRSRIAELEESHAQVIHARDHYKALWRESLKGARTVTVKLPELCVGVVQGGHAVMVPYAAGHWFNKTAILEMLTAEGIKWETE